MRASIPFILITLFLIFYSIMALALASPARAYAAVQNVQDLRPKPNYGNLYSGLLGADPYSNDGLYAMHPLQAQQGPASQSTANNY